MHKSEATYGPIPWISKRVIHPHISIHFTRFLLLAGLTGNQATLVMMMTAFVGASLFFVGGRSGFIGGSLLMVLSWILDHSDGEVRRFRGEDSSLNIYMDRFTHRVSYPLMHVGTGFALWRESSDPRLVLFGCTVAYFYQLGVAHYLDKSLIEKERGDVDLGPLRTARLALTARWPLLHWPLKLLVAGYANFIQHNTFFVLMILSTLTGWVKPFYLFYGTVLIFNWVLNVALDFTMAFRPSAAGRSATEPSGDIRMH
ncbi:MAG: hypothetical protein ACRD21_03710 [Vicinamibacteria bacterium]